MALTCIKSARGDTCATHGGAGRGRWSAWFVIDEHEFEGCIVGAAEYIAELENDLSIEKLHRTVLLVDEHGRRKANPSIDPADPERLDKLDF